MGYMRTAVLMAAMTALFMGIGYLLAGFGGMIFALFAAAGALSESFLVDPRSFHTLLRLWFFDQFILVLGEYHYPHPIR